MKINCKICGKKIHLTPYLVRMKKKYCSLECQHDGQKKTINKVCLVCKSEFKTILSQNAIFCSNKFIWCP